MYYPKLKVVFPHIVKTGGSSLEYFIGQVEHKELFEKKYKNVRQKMKFLNDLYRRYQLEPEGKRWNIHRRAKEYKHALGDTYDDYYSFAFVRNPFSQIKSLYSMNAEDHGKRKKEYPTWESYIFSEKRGYHFLKNQGLWLDQRELLSEDGELIVNEIFPFEYYNDAVNKLAKKLKFTPDLEVKLWSTKPKYDYTPEMIEVVMERYHKSYDFWKKVLKHWEKTGRPYAGRKKGGSSHPS